MSDQAKTEVQNLDQEQNRVGTFTFLSSAELGLLKDPNFVEGLAKGRTLSQQDSEILQDICSTLRDAGTMPFSWTPQEAHYIDGHGQEKWLDYIIYRYKFTLFPRKKIVSDFPVYLLIEPASTCNLRCVMCFQVDKTFTRKPYMGLMDMGLFREVVDQAVSGGTQAVTLASRGEPTLHPQLGEMLEYLAGKFIEVKLTTNATKLTEKLCHQILETGVNMLVLSVDAHTKSVYEDIRVRGKFDDVEKNIRMFHRIREEFYPSSNLATRISGVRFREDQDPVGFKAFWGEIVDEVGMKDAMERWDTYANDPNLELTSPCWFLWERMYIWFDGSTNPCDPDYKSHLSPGNVREQSIHDIWHGDALTKLRTDHLNGRRTEHFPCDRCNLSFE